MRKITPPFNSIVMGVKLSGATVQTFRHNDMKDLQMCLRKSIISKNFDSERLWDKILIIVEGVYSMEGSIANLPEIIKLKRKYKAYLYLDEAHSMGSMGPSDRGIVEYCGCNPKDVDILMGTFTKSFGSSGGYLAGSRDLIQMLRKNSPTHTYGMAMTGPIAEQIISSLKIISGDDGTLEGRERIQRLAASTKYFRGKLKQLGFTVYGNDDSPVVPVLIFVFPKMVYMFRKLIQRGIATVAVGYPATPLMESRMRFCISSSHTKEDLDYTLNTLQEIGQKLLLCKSDE